MNIQRVTVQVSRVYTRLLLIVKNENLSNLKNTSNEQNIGEYYMSNHRVRDLLVHYNKGVILLQFWYDCFKRMHHLSFRARANDVSCILTRLTT